MAYNILIVDDSATVRAVIRKTLDLAEVPVARLFQAANGAEALTVLSDEWIDLVFADLNMPVMTGTELVERMSQDGLLARIPVIIVSTEGSQTRIQELLDRGVSAFIRKPFAPEELREVVGEVMGETK